MNAYFRAAPVAVASLLLASTAVMAQPAPSAEAARDWPDIEPDRPWIYRGSDVPPDVEWEFGELENGLRYAVRTNEVPQDQISIRVRIDAGALHEQDSERGFAHLLEHLTFRESKYLAEGETIPRWEALGATFGSDTNAETSATHTVYKLDVPNMDPEKLDEVMRLLSGMVTAPALTEHGVRTEVPIVLAERRERGGASRRISDASRETYFAGQRLAERSPIGTVETLEGADAVSVRAFHDRWYRPGNTVVSIAGDFPTAQLEAAVEKWFGSWNPSGPTVPAPSFGDPVARSDARIADGALAPVGGVRVLVEPGLPRNIGYGVMRPWRKVADTIEYNEGLLIDQLALALINRRLEARARGGGSYLQAGVEQQDVSRSVDATFVSVTPLGENWKAALMDVRAVIADALATPPTEAEIAREYAEYENAFRIGVETREVQQMADLADDIVRAVDIRETVAAPETVLMVLEGMKPKVTPDRVLAQTRALFTGAVVRGMMIVPDESEASEAAFQQAMLAPVTADASARLDEKQISFDELPTLGTPGTLVAAEPAGIMEIETLTFDNGVKALIWPNDAEPGRINLRVRFGNGYGAFDAEDAPYIALGQNALMGAGIGELGQEELDRISTGRKMGLDFGIEDDEFVMSAETRAADLTDQLYLFAAKLAMPRWDEAPILRSRAAMQLGYTSYSSSPQGVMARDLEYLLRGGDPRFYTESSKELDGLTPEGFREVWEPVLKTGPIQIEMFGDFTREQAIEAIAKSFGALPERTPSAPLATLSRYPETGRGPVVLGHDGDPDQAAAIIAWPTGGGRENIRLSRQLEILSQLFNNRLFDAMRERLGASYAPNVGSRWPLDRSDGGYIIATAQLQPKDVPAFYEEARQIARDLVAQPPTNEEIGRVTEPLRQLISRASSGNGFWINQLAGAARDPRRLDQVRTILSDYSETTPEAMQQLAQMFLAGEQAFEVSIVPEAQVEGQPAPAPRIMGDGTTGVR